MATGRAGTELPHARERRQAKTPRHPQQPQRRPKRESDSRAHAVPCAPAWRARLQPSPELLHRLRTRRAMCPCMSFPDSRQRAASSELQPYPAPCRAPRVPLPRPTGGKRKRAASSELQPCPAPCRGTEGTASSFSNGAKQGTASCPAPCRGKRGYRLLAHFTSTGDRILPGSVPWQAKVPPPRSLKRRYRLLAHSAP
jgi:hypothetical protein